MHDIGGNRGAGHAEDDLTGLVLGDNVPAEFMQRKQAIDAIASHARQNDADRLRPVHIGDRLE